LVYSSMTVHIQEMQSINMTADFERYESVYQKRVVVDVSVNENKDDFILYLIKNDIAIFPFLLRT